MAAFTDIDLYQRRHGQAPAGDGDFAFVIAGDRHGRCQQRTFAASGSFAGCCRAAYRVARHHGWSADSITLTVLP